jgi:hypothetical protein
MGRIEEYEAEKSARRRFWLGWCPPAVAFLLLCAVSVVPGQEPAAKASPALAWVLGADTGAAADPEFDTLALLALE